MQLCFILVQPKHPEHVGAAARALKTMGFQALRLVGNDLHQHKTATILAHGSDDILENTTSYPDLATAIADQDFVVGTTAKQRHHRRYSTTPEELRANLNGKQGAVARAAIVFGREDRGLDNNEIALCHALSRVPLANNYPSINLAQAVMVYAYALSGVGTEAKLSPADIGQYQALLPKLEQLLDKAGIESTEKTWQWAMERAALGGEKDIKFLHFICDKLLTSGK